MCAILCCLHIFKSSVYNHMTAVFSGCVHSCVTVILKWRVPLPSSVKLTERRALFKGCDTVRVRTHPAQVNVSGKWLTPMNFSFRKVLGMGHEVTKWLLSSSFSWLRESRSEEEDDSGLGSMASLEFSWREGLEAPSARG